MWPFKGEKKKPIRSTDRVPTGRVITLSSQGLSEPEIIKTLKNEGYTPLQVDQAMKEALRTSVGTGGSDMDAPRPPTESYSQPAGTRYRPEDVPGLPPLPTEMEPSDLPPAPSDEPPLLETPRGMSSLDMPEPGRDFDESLPGEEIPRLRERMTRREARDEKRRALEELAESIIEEKWIGFRDELMNLKSQMQETNFKVSSLEQSMKQIQGDKKTDMEQIEEKIDTYKQSMHEVSARMGSIESAMKDSLTPMMQSLRSLTETIRSLKSKKE
jgi:hypothetical protein